MHLKPDTLLQGGKYKIIRHISSGGFGNTYEAQDIANGKRLALKEFYVSSMCSREPKTGIVIISDKSKTEMVKRARRKFIEEAQTLLIMQHPNVVKAYDMFDENGTSYYTMEYYVSGSLKEKLDAEGKLSEDQALIYIKEVCGALQYIHSHNRLHLDLKPGNIMLNSEGHAVLIDFGVSKQYSEHSNTNNTTLLGKSPGYAPIEQLDNSVQVFSPSTDIYALGATFYKLITGYTPPSAAVLLNGEIDFQSLDISQSTINTIRACMKLRKEERPQSIDEVLSLLTANTEQTVMDDVSGNVDPDKLGVDECDKVGVSYWSTGDYEKAMEYFESGWKRGGLNALFHLALCYEQKGDYLTSTRLLKQASDKGHLDAQCQLAMCFEQGLGVPQNHRAAVKLCESAAKRGSLYGKEKLKGLDRSFGSLANYGALKRAILWLLAIIPIIIIGILTGGIAYFIIPLFFGSTAFYHFKSYMKSLKY